MNAIRGGHAATRASGAGSDGERGRMIADLRERVQRRLLAELNPRVDSSNPAEVRHTLEQIFGEVLVEEEVLLSRRERAELFDQMVAQILGYGPLEALLQDDSITEIMVNGADIVYVERNGMLEETDVRFRDAEEVLHIINRIVAPLGRRIDESSPMVDARLPDGSRVNAIIPPLSLIGPVVSIRRFPATAMTTEDLIHAGTMTPEIADFLQVCVQAKLNIIVSGGTSTGKTTFLNVLSSFLPGKERIITIEDAAELQLHRRHVIPLEARPPNIEGRGEVPIRQLVINALRMRPDRIVVGEVRGAEALDMLQAMNTGHEGSMTTAHSNSPRDTLARIETMVLMAGMDLPLRAIREQIASAFDLIVHLDRLMDGTRRITKVAEVQGMEGDVIVMQDIFQFKQDGGRDGRPRGGFSATGVRPKFMEKIEEAGFFVQPSIFVPAQPTPHPPRW